MSLSHASGHSGADPGLTRDVVLQIDGTASESYLAWGPRRPRLRICHLADKPLSTSSDYIYYGGLEHLSLINDSDAQVRY